MAAAARARLTASRSGSPISTRIPTVPPSCSSPTGRARRRSPTTSAASSCSTAATRRPSPTVASAGKPTRPPATPWCTGSRPPAAAGRRRRKPRSFGGDVSALLCDRAFHQRYHERDRERHHGENPEAVEIRKCGSLLLTQVFDRLPGQLLQGRRIADFELGLRLHLLDEGTDGWV